MDASAAPASNGGRGGLSGSRRKPSDCEVREDRKLPALQELPEMGCGALIRLPSSAKDGYVTQC